MPSNFLYVYIFCFWIWLFLVCSCAQRPFQNEGDIIHKTIAIESGAHFEGSVQRQDDPLATGVKAKTEFVKKQETEVKN